MLETLKKILEGVLQRLDKYETTVLPSLLAGLVLVLAAWAIAACARWLLYRLFKGPAIDRFLRTSGLAFMLDPRGRLRATRLVAEIVYWCILLSGILLGLSAFDTQFTTLIIQRLVLLMPKLVVAGIILLAGFWLSQYLGRMTVVWAVNEGVPSPRRLATAVRVLIMFVAVVVAANQLDFASSVFLAAFIILVGGAVLTVSLAAGIGASDRFRRYFEERSEHAEDSRERSLWSHL
jgi:hypothetical protein